MKKFIAIASMALLFTACNTKKSGGNESTSPGTETSAQVKDINSPYPVNYSSKFVMDDPKNAETLLSLWKDFDNGTLAGSKDKFSDTVEMHFADGSSIRVSRDSLLATAQKERSSFKSVVSSVDAIMAVKSTDKNEHWALIWGMEKVTDAKGKSDSSHIQETWRFDSTGRANFMEQFRRAPTPPKMMKK
ncbi:MAG: hypothetical protein IT214_00495 [Chitinophagaceae bacterium]|jgi:hypothetical protein|nr:hypothetical protein [Chitinophagaceae bacterium]